MTEITPNDIGPSSPSFLKGGDLYGHPPGLWVLTVTEAWLSFSLYGVLSLLVLYMSKAVFADQQTMASILGLKPLLSLIDALYSPVGVEAISGGLMGLFMALVFVLPLFGSFLADRVLGRTRTILLGAVLMTVGDVFLCFRACFVLALLALLLGTGLAGSMKAQVGALYTQEDRRRSDAYQIYSLGVQIAVIIAPVLCATMSEFFLWKGGFLTAGIGMATGVACYLLGARFLPSEPVRRGSSSMEEAGSERMSVLERKRIWLLFGLVGVFALSALPNEELNDGYVLWASQHYRLTFFGYPFPVSYLMSLDGVISTVTTLAVLWGLQFYEKRYGNVQELGKIALGAFIAGFGPIVLALGSWLSPGMNQVSLWWGIVFHTINDIGFALSYSIGMALFSRLAPVGLNTIFVSFFMLHMFFSNLLVGKLSTLLSRISDIAFWLYHAGASFLSALLFFVCIFCFRNLLGNVSKQTGL